ncbi:MAG: flavodoxin family protein [Dehalococcoidales bacterium]|nr:flavodoxin family protein [Dehalococcoidales bacterium]
MAMTTILGIGGSPRKDGNSDILLKEILAGAARAGAATEEVQLRDLHFQSCIGCEGCRPDHICKVKADMQQLYPKISAAQGLALVSPTHNYNITALMKAFIDRMYCYFGVTDDRPRDWWSTLAGQGRRAGLVVIGEQPEADDANGLSMTALRLPITSYGYEIAGELPVIGIFDKGGVLDKPGVLADARKLGSELAKPLMKA